MMDRTRLTRALVLIAGGILIVGVGMLVWQWGMSGSSKPVVVSRSYPDVSRAVSQEATETTKEIQTEAQPTDAVTENIVANKNEAPDTVKGDMQIVSSQLSQQENQSQKETKQEDAEVKPTKQSSGQTDASLARARFVAFGFTKTDGLRERSIDTIVIHSTYNALDGESGDVFDTGRVIEEYRQAGVSPHYLVARDGTVYQLVREWNVAWHAGVSKMPGKNGRTNVNDFSIGIEMIGTKTSGYTDKQYAGLKKLIADIKSRHTIKYVVGHDDIAPGRKTDPWEFDWKKL